MKTLACLILLLSGLVLADDFKWALKPDSDSKVVLNLDQLPHDYLFEFWFDGSGPVITKNELIQAIEMVTREKLQAKRSCLVGAGGEILNYPCILNTAKPVITAQNSGK